MTAPGAEPNLLNTTAAAFVRPVQACNPSDNLSHAARLMWELDCGFLPVCDRSGQLVGVITDRDVCMAAYTRGQVLDDIQVWSTMSTQVVSVGPNATLREVLRLMGEMQVRRVPIVDGTRLLGAVTLADLALYIDANGGADEASTLSATLATISQPRSNPLPSVI